MTIHRHNINSHKSEKNFLKSILHFIQINLIPFPHLCSDFYHTCHIDGLVQDCGISIANVVETPQSYTKPLTWSKSFDEAYTERLILSVHAAEYPCDISHKYHACWCPGSLRHQAISRLDIDNACPTGPCLPYWQITTVYKCYMGIKELLPNL